LQDNIYREVLPRLGSSLVIAASRLADTLRHAEDFALEAVILACTHFITIKPFVADACSLRIIDVGSLLVNRTVTAVRERSMISKLMGQYRRLPVIVTPR
jgi:glutamate racemase